MERTPKRTPCWEYEVTGALRIGPNLWFGSGGTWPFGQLRASRKELLLHLRWGFWEPDVVLPRERVSKVGRLRGFLRWGGIRFEHDVGRFQRYVAFWPLPGERERVLTELRAMGYPVE